MWWENIKADGCAGLTLMLKLKKLKEEIKEWTKNQFGDVRSAKIDILEEIKSLDIREESHFLI